MANTNSPVLTLPGLGAQPDPEIAGSTTKPSSLQDVLDDIARREERLRESLKNLPASEGKPCPFLEKTYSGKADIVKDLDHDGNGESDLDSSELDLCLQRLANPPEIL